MNPLFFLLVPKAGPSRSQAPSDGDKQFTELFASLGARPK
jgi:hypothetical protein